MATSYPDRTNARGIWRLSDITRNIKTEGTFPNAGSRGIFSAGRDSPSDINIIDFVTISTTGNATDFGDHTGAKRYLGGCASFTRGIFAGGYPATNVVDYITIASTGNAADFGDLTDAKTFGASCSNGHGGLS